MKHIIAICRQEKISKKKLLYGIGFVIIFSIVTNLQIFWFYGIRTDINMVLNCNKTFYLWSVNIPAIVIQFLIPMILLTVTNVLTIRQVNIFPQEDRFGVILTPCWSPLIFWNIHFGIYFKLKKKFSYKLTEFFFQCSLKFFFSSRLITEKKFQWSLKKNFS